MRASWSCRCRFERKSAWARTSVVVAMLQRQSRHNQARTRVDGGLRLNGERPRVPSIKARIRAKDFTASPGACGSMVHGQIAACFVRPVDAQAIVAWPMRRLSAYHFPAGGFAGWKSSRLLACRAWQPFSTCCNRCSSSSNALGPLSPEQDSSRPELRAMAQGQPIGQERWTGTPRHRQAQTKETALLAVPQRVGQAFAQ